MARKVTLTPEQRRERLEQASDQLTAAVEAIATGEDWQRYMDFANKLHKYSARNVAMLMQQAYQREWVNEQGMPELGHVAGFRTWLTLDRHVRKGERGLAVLAPCGYKVRDTETGEESFQVRGFKVEHVFAARQTDGDGEIPSNPIRAELLTGEGPDGAWNALVAQIEAQGFTLERGPLFPANGETSFSRRSVIVSDRLEGAAAVKTLAHELAHVLLHENVDYHPNRARCEIEAESVAYLVCQSFELSSDAYSFGYVASWSGGDIKVVMAAADKAIKCAEQILMNLEPMVVAA